MAGLEMFTCEWPDPGGACWEVNKWEPCCGEPCNPTDGAYCTVCWWICGWCSFAKMYASSLDQDECALINHCLILCCNFCAVFNVITRHNLRARLGIGPDKDNTMGWVGDFLMIFFCCCCVQCQMLRAIKKDEWDWWKQVNGSGVIKVSVDPFKLVRD